ncbi:MAG: hypothetical protein K8W52_30670 [Deltaproteobacteria bacterium]|nr:hypothetical protein [Deltaproteobacteria bacterium]
MPNRTRDVVVALLVAAGFDASSARADERSWRSPGYVGVGGETSVDLWFNDAFVVEGGVRVKSSPVLVHALVAQGRFIDDTVTGHYQAYRIGAEVEPCTRRGFVCGVFGLDLGYVSQRPNIDQQERRTAWLGFARAGIDVGYHHLRARLTLDLRNGHDSVTGATNEPRGAGVTATVGYAF